MGIGPTPATLPRVLRGQAAPRFGEEGPAGGTDVEGSPEHSLPEGVVMLLSILISPDRALLPNSDFTKV